MDSAILKQLAALQPEHVIGPEHHRFRLKEPLSAHPLGQLWQADDIATTQPTPVTLLILPAELLAREGFVERLREQLNRNRSLNDRYSARCYGLFTWRGLFFTSWEPLDGLTLAQMFQSGQARKLNKRQKQGMVSQVALALEAHLNQTGQPHATLCPELIYINRRNGVRLMGYGWRELLEPVLPQLPQLPGYHAWQSPQAFQPGPLNSSEDVYALACMIYQLYGGKALFALDDNELSRERELKAPGGISREQWTVLQAALATDCELRPATPAELLRQFYDPPPPKATAAETQDAATTPAPEAPNPVNSTDTSASPQPGPARIWRWQPPTWSARLAAALALFTAGLALGYWLGWQHSPTPVPQAPRVLAEAVPADSRQARPVPPSATETIDSTESTLSVSAPTQPSAPGAEIISGETLRQNQYPADNLTLFRDQWAPDRYAPQMVVLPKGRFRMGDLHGQGDDNEYPVHEVVIAHSFALGRHEVTFDEYDQFAIDTGRALPDDEGWGRGRQPVINVSWEDARAYAAWLAQQTGEPYRLPSEAEWEYAARAGTETLYWWGDRLTSGMAVCDGCGTEWDGRKPAPAGHLSANPWGLHELNGNVDEWVQDCYSPSYENAPNDGSARDAPNCQQRVMRGGSWFEIPRLVRSASRYRHPPTSHRNSWGFRVALDLPTP